MKFKPTLLILTALVFCAGFSRNVAACPGITLPAATTGNTMSFGVALVYALPILGVNAPSSPSQISDCIVVAADSNGELVGINSAITNNLYGAGGSSNSRNGGPLSAGDQGEVSKANGDAAITWDTMTNALQAFLAGRPGLANFNLFANATKANTQARNGGVVTSDAALPGSGAAPAGSNTAPAGSNTAPVGSDAAPGGSNTAPGGGNTAPVGSDASLPRGDAAPVGGDAVPGGGLILPAANAAESPELKPLLDLANFDVAAVPEPDSLVLFGMGLLALGLWRVTRRRK